MKKLGKAFAAIAIAGAVAAGGSAFTNSNTVVDSTAGIAETVVSGITVTSVDYDITGDGADAAVIDQVNLVQTDDPADPADNNLDVVVYFNTTGTPFACGVGAVDAVAHTISYACPITGGGQDVEAVTKLFVTAVSNDDV
jgi:hypothetical protein